MVSAGIQVELDTLTVIYIVWQASYALRLCDLSESFAQLPYIGHASHPSGFSLKRRQRLPRLAVHDCMAAMACCA